MRNIIQICSEDAETNVVVLALCDDHTVWQLIYNDMNREQNWRRLPAIPQDEK